MRRLGCTVTLVATGDKVFSFFAPDLEVTDVLLPGFGGAQLFQAMRSDPATSSWVVVATWVMGPADVGRSCDAVLPEPFGRRDFDRALNLLRDLEEEK